MALSQQMKATLRAHSNFQAVCRLDSALHAFITITDFSMVHFGPLYVALGLALILAVSYAYLALIYRQMYAEKGPVHAALHLVFGLGLLYNVLLNYWLCIATPPGSTAAMKEVPTLYLDTPDPEPRTMPQHAP